MQHSWTFQDPTPILGGPIPVLCFDDSSVWWDQDDGLVLRPGPGVDDSVVVDEALRHMTVSRILSS
jgi:hypothetical protein